MSFRLSCSQVKFFRRYFSINFLPVVMLFSALFHGCYRLADLVGFEVGVASGMTFIEAFPERVYKSMLFPFLMEDKRLG